MNNMRVRPGDIGCSSLNFMCGAAAEHPHVCMHIHKCRCKTKHAEPFAMTDIQSENDGFGGTDLTY